MPAASSRWLIIGLGNPGVKYANTRHNLGARVVETLKGELTQPAFRTAQTLRARVSRGATILAIPTTFMNDSGRAVRAMVKKFSVPLDRLLVIHDDKDLAFGQLKLQNGRSAAGHNGVQSIMDTLGSQDFWRLRVGVGAPPPRIATDAYVLEAFSPDEERDLANAVLPSAVRAARRAIGI